MSACLHGRIGRLQSANTEPLRVRQQAPLCRKNADPLRMIAAQDLQKLPAFRRGERTVSKNGPLDLWRPRMHHLAQHQRRVGSRLFVFLILPAEGSDGGMAEFDQYLSYLFDKFLIAGREQMAERKHRA